MKKSLLTSMLAVLTLSVTGITLAHNHGGDEEHADRGYKKHHKMHRERMHEYMMKKVDTNEDGQIDLSEYLANAEQRFKNIDLNGDGYVTREEHKEAGKMMREKHREMRKKMRAEREAEQKAGSDKSE